MPELPEVENFNQYFKKHGLNKEIRDVLAKRKSFIKKASFDELRNFLKGKSFAKVERRGKYLIVEVKKSNKKIVFHFGMTGNLSLAKSKEHIPKYAQLSFVFKDGSALCYNNKRLLGKIFLVEEADGIEALQKMGPEPSTLSQEDFLKILKQNEKRNIKAFLMDQSKIAGIGNEYSDEILFQARISPRCKIDSLKRSKREQLYQLIGSVLKKAIKVGPPGGEFDDSWLIAHRGRGDDMKCPDNKKHELKKETIAGRSSVYCPKHQK